MEDAYLASHSLQLDDAGVDDRIDIGWKMGALLWVSLAVQPFHEVEITGSIERDWIAVEEVRHNCVIAIRSELIGVELSVVEAVADDICDTGEISVCRELKSFASLSFERQVVALGSDQN